MPQIISLHDKNAIEAFVRRNPFLHLLELGDLDDFFWPFTVWYGWQVGDVVQQIALVYTAMSTPVLLAYGEPPRDQVYPFMEALLPLLPRRLYAHLDPRTLDLFEEFYDIEERGQFLKMGLTNPERVRTVDSRYVETLTEADEDALLALYAGYPENQFNARNLQTGHYFGVRESGLLVSAGGVHVYSPAYHAAVIGNMMTHPARRGRGIGTQVCAKLCQTLLAEGVTHIGLNVEAENAPAIGIYEKLGFERLANFGAYNLMPPGS